MNKQLYHNVLLVSILMLIPLFLLEAKSTVFGYSPYFTIKSYNDTIPNKGNGIFINNASKNIIGQLGARVTNTIVGNEYGIYISGDSNQVFNNVIGSDTLLNESLGNIFSGVFVNGVNNQIGGNTPDSVNLIVNNGANGIEIAGSNTYRNIIVGNAIGTDVEGAKNLGNNGAGIIVTNARDNRIGGMNISENNTIAFNREAGVTILGNQAINNSILVNKLYSNEGLGIDLSNNGVTLNDLNDLDKGPNGLLNFPEVTSLFYDGQELAYEFSLNVQQGSYIILFYNNTTSDPSGYGEGAFFLGAVTIQHSGQGQEYYRGTFLPNYPPDNEDNITLTATELVEGRFENTSEFSDFKAITSICENITTPGKISGIEVNCGSYVPTSIVSLTQARGGTGSPIEYKWQKSLDNEIWTDIPNSNSASYNVGLIKKTTMFRRAARRANCMEGWVYSNVINKDVVSNISNAGQISGNETSLKAFTPSEITSLQPASGGVGQIDYQWYLKTVNSSWTLIPDAKGLSYTPPFITETTYYKREAHIVSCDYTSCCGSNPFLYSNTIAKKVISPLKEGGEIFYSFRHIEEYVPLITIIQSYLNAVKEKDNTTIYLRARSTKDRFNKRILEYKWETSMDGAHWKEVYGATKEEYHLKPVDKTLFYRRKARKKNTSIWAYSNIIKLPRTIIQTNEVKKAPSLENRAQKYPTQKMLLALNIFLEGAMGDNNLMRDDIRAKNLLPLTSPYDSSQNYENEQYLNSSVLHRTGENAITDWVLIEIYPSNSADSIDRKPVFTTSGLIQRDGDIVDYDGSSPVQLSKIPEGYYWIVIRHRNHEPVISTHAIPLKKGMINSFIDFCSDRNFNPKEKVKMMTSSIHLKKDFFHTLKNQMKTGYELLDYDMNGVLITKGPNNEYSSFLGKSY